MEMSATKSSIITNLRDIPDDLSFTLQGDPISTIADNKQITRYLGVFWTLDSEFKQTIENTITKLDQAIKCIPRCHLPSKITTHLVNTVIIPGIAYQLQLIPITKTHIDTINRKMWKIIKQKYRLPPNTSDHVLYDKQWGIGLINIQQCLEQTHLTNMNIWLAEPAIH